LLVGVKDNGALGSTGGDAEGVADKLPNGVAEKLTAGEAAFLKSLLPSLDRQYHLIKNDGQERYAAFLTFPLAFPGKNCYTQSYIGSERFPAIALFS
jgi:hypothetical protein